MAKIGKFKNSKDLRYSFYFHKEVFIMKIEQNIKKIIESIKCLKMK